MFILSSLLPLCCETGADGALGMSCCLRGPPRHTPRFTCDCIGTRAHNSTEPKPDQSSSCDSPITCQTLQWAQPVGAPQDPSSQLSWNRGSFSFWFVSSGTLGGSDHGCAAGTASVLSEEGQNTTSQPRPPTLSLTLQHPYCDPQPTPDTPPCPPDTPTLTPTPPPCPPDTPTLP